MENTKRFERHEVSVRDVMTKSPVMIREQDSVKKAADLMKDSDIGSLVVMDEDDELTGIVTEMDIVKKVVAENISSDEVTVKDIMSSPVHTIEGKKYILDAAESMAEKNIRRLPVMEKGKMIGLITENEILEISPTLIDITREYDRISRKGEMNEYGEHVEKETSGYCESCGVYSDRLTSENSQLLCPECYR